MKELPKICNRLKQDLYNLYKFTQDTLSKIVDNVNQSLDEQGLLNKFGGDSLIQGYHDGNDGNLRPDKEDWVTSKNRISCKVGDKIRLFSGYNSQSISFVFYNSTNQVVLFSLGDVQTVPSNATSFHFNINNTGITPSTANDVSIYINNEIYEIKNYLTNVPLKLNSGNNILKIKKNLTDNTEAFGVVISGYEGVGFCAFVDSNVGTIGYCSSLYGSLISQEGYIQGEDGNRFITITAPNGIEFEIVAQ